MLNTNILNINPEIVCNLIVKAKEFHAKEGVTFTEPISSAARKEAKQNITTNLTAYLMSKPLIADYFANGLAILGYSCNM